MLGLLFGLRDYKVCRDLSAMILLNSHIVQAFLFL